MRVTTAPNSLRFDRRKGRARDRLLLLFSPVLVLGALTALAALVAGLLDWRGHEMFIAAAGIGLATSLLALLLTYLHAVESRALLRNEARLRSILETAMDAIITIDEGQRIVMFNKVAESMFGWPRDEVIGAPLDMLIPARFRARHAEYVDRYGKTGINARPVNSYRTVGALRRDGTEFLINAYISQVSDGVAKFYTVTMRDITKQVDTESALIALQAELRNLALMSSLSREQEKRRISRELHDELGQAMTALKMDVSWIAQQLKAEQHALKGKLVGMQSTLDDTVAAMRRIAANLRPLILDDLGFVAAVESLVENFSDHNGIRCELDIADPDMDLTEPYATELFRVLQESLTNVAKHSQASVVEVSIRQADDEFMLTVRDNGRGFVTSDPRRPESYGLLGLHERAYLLEGKISIDSAPGRGAVVSVRFPLARPARDCQDFSV